MKRKLYFLIFTISLFCFSCFENDLLGDWYLNETKITVYEDHLIFNGKPNDIIRFKKIDKDLFEFLIDEKLEESWKLKILNLSNDSLIIYDSLLNKTYKLDRFPSSSI